MGGDGGEPAQRLLQEGEGRHQHGLRAEPQRGQNGAEEPHVVMRRQPVDADAGPVEREAFRHHRGIGGDVAMGDDDAARLRRRARAELDDGGGVGPRLVWQGVRAAGGLDERAEVQEALAERRIVGFDDAGRGR
ncbi:hypothetical protein OH818_12305 [Jiella pelagia]|uniref:Uncharacterized protein n=1 Tax=Jiella pelagia TaxID=2986949 RepID=A0ABY7C4Q0_9HYPH|nr:hypothetical protein [Jiella pelagia]WAP70721.1 hypothetical protein OH818_12305 [Jiella pelagia]